MEFKITTATEKVAELEQRIRAIQGGTSAGKTISILQILIDASQRDEVPKITSVVSESLPHLKKGAMRDFKNIMMSAGYWDDASWNTSDSIYVFPPSKAAAKAGHTKGSIIEFFGADQASKVRGPRRDRLYMNEANNMGFEAFEQLEVRTRETIWLDWNPTNEFWFYTDVLNVRDDVDHLTITYLDNEALEPNIVASIEQRKNRKGWWQVYGLGLLGEVDGKIYKDWQIIDAVPHEARLERYGLDFGYSNDPSSIVAVYRHDGGLILDEVLYQKGMLNSQLADVIQNQENPTVLVVADSAEPKSIDELKLHGINIMPTTKGKDSVKHGIDLVQDQRISVTKRSVNVIKEYRNYLWRTNREGELMVPPQPEHTYSHSMDAIRYAIVSLPKLVQPLTEEQKATRNFQRAMKRKHAMRGGMRSKERKFVT